MSSEKLVMKAMSGERVERLPVAPLVCSYAGRIRSLEPQELLSDPTKLANSLVDALELFGYDAVLTWFDTTAEAEACGCAVDWKEGSPSIKGPADGRTLAGLDPEEIIHKGRLPIAREVAVRLVRQLGHQISLLGALSGPFTLCRQLSGEEMRGNPPAYDPEMMELAGAVATSMVRLYGEAGVDGVVIAEDASVDDILGILPMARHVYDQVLGNARHFELGTMLVIRRGSSAGSANLAEELLPDCAVLGGEGLSEGLGRCREGGVVPAIAVTENALLEGREAVAGDAERCLEVCGGETLILTTAWEVPFDAPVESLREMVEAGRRSRS